MLSCLIMATVVIPKEFNYLNPFVVFIPKENEIVTEIGFPRITKNIFISNSSPYEKPFVFSLHNRRNIFDWILLINNAIYYKLLPWRQDSITKNELSRFIELISISDISIQNIRHYFMTNISGWGESGISHYWGGSKSKFPVLARRDSNINGNVSSYLFMKNFLHESSIILSSFGNIFHSTRRSDGLSDGVIHFSSLSSTSLMSIIPEFPCITSQYSGYKNQHTSEGSNPKIGMVVPLFMLIGLESLGFYIQISGYARIESGRKIYGYMMLIAGIIIGFSPLFAWIYYNA